MILQDGKVFEENDLTVEIDPNQLLRNRQQALDTITNFEAYLVTINAKIDAVKALGFEEVDVEGVVSLVKPE